MQKVNHPIKARMYIGGLKSLLVDIVNEIEEIEKTGGVSGKFIENLVDVKAAIDLTLTEFKKVTVRCCEHGESHDTCDESCHDDYCEECGGKECFCEEGRVEDDVVYCSDCNEPEGDCICYDEEVIVPPRKMKKSPQPKVNAHFKKKGKQS